MKTLWKHGVSSISVCGWWSQRWQSFSSLMEVLMRGNAHRHRILNGRRPFGIIIPPVPPLFFSWFRLIDSPLNVALHLDVIRTVLSEKMKELSIPGLVPFILHKWQSHFIYQCNSSAPPQRRSCLIRTVSSSIRTGIHVGVDIKNGHEHGWTRTKLQRHCTVHLSLPQQSHRPEATLRLRTQ